LRAAGIPLHEALYDVGGREWASASLRPDLFLHEEWAVTMAGVAVATAIQKSPFQHGPRYSLAVERTCPVFPGATWRLTWPLESPAATRSQQERRAATRRVRDAIREHVVQFVQEHAWLVEIVDSDRLAINAAAPQPSRLLYFRVN